MHYNVISDSGKRVPRKKILNLMAKIEEEEEPPSSTVNIVFVDDNRIVRLNKEYRGKTGPTDVLSFNLDDDEGVDSIFGEIYISTDTASKNADSSNLTFSDEILRLCCHGFLHLLGYDHEKENERIIMEQRENHYLEML